VQHSTRARSAEWRRAAAIIIALVVGLGVTLVTGSKVRASDPATRPVRLQGILAHYTLTTTGDINGFVLADGTQINVLRHLATSLVLVARPGDPVTVQGRRQKVGPAIDADDVRNDTSGAVLAGRGPKPRPDLGSSQVTGKVQFMLHGPDGALDGVVLEDGTVLRLPPENLEQFAAQLAPGLLVVAQGRLLSTPFGRVVDVNRLK
jgi:hypothetical protein